MSRKQHGKQVARAREKRQSDRFERRSARNRVLIVAMAVLLALSLFAIPLTQWIASRSDPAGFVPDPDAAAATPLPPVDPVPADEVYAAPFELTIDTEASYHATLSTTEGDIRLELDPVGAPLTTNNLVNLAQDGYYDGVIFHRVIESFVVQAGDPAGTGCGQFACDDRFDPTAPTYPGYTFEDELGPAAELFQEAGGYPRGTLAMANAGPNTNGSQFFIVQGELVELPPQFTVFGRVVEGMDVVDAIATTPTDPLARPVEDVVIQSVIIEEG